MNETKKRLLEDIRVLVVDDDKSVRKIIEKQLTSRGAEVTLADNGRGGLEQILTSDFDVMVADIRMEGMDGFTFLVEALRIRPWLGAVIVSGFLDQHIADRARELGVKELLDKPIDMEELTLATRRVFDEKKNILSMPAAFSMDRFRYELETLRRLTRAAVESATMKEALWKFAHGLGDAMESPALGLCILIDTPTLIIAKRPGWPEEAEDALENSIRLRYRALNGEDLPQQLRVESETYEGQPVEATSLDVYQTIPIIQDGKVLGLVSLVTAVSAASSDRGTAFLYHAANHLAAVLFAFNRTRALAITDELTGLFNRRHLLEQIRYLTNLCSRYRMPLSVALLDLDDFKAVNDNYGHTTGDALLRATAAKLRSVTRKADIVARYGGDEIAFVLPNTGVEGARTWACRMLAELASSSFKCDDNEISISATIGITTAMPAPSAEVTPAQLVETADQALLEAKREQQSHYALRPLDMPVAKQSKHFDAEPDDEEAD